MATLDSVEKLKERANVSYEEARAALDACNDDLLEAVIYLENNGKVPPPKGTGFFSTLHNPSNQNRNDSTNGAKSRGDSFGDAMRRLRDWLAKMIKKGNTNHFEVWRKEERFLVIPVTLLVILLVCCFWITLPLIIVGLFLGFRYRFQGPELGENKVNSVMNSAANAADQLKNEVWKPENKEHKSE